MIDYQKGNAEGKNSSEKSLMVGTEKIKQNKKETLWPSAVMFHPIYGSPIRALLLFE